MHTGDHTGSRAHVFTCVHTFMFTHAHKYTCTTTEEVRRTEGGEIGIGFIVC